jgi:membrane-bound lytic murein transglycosylase B
MLKKLSTSFLSCLLLLSASSLFADYSKHPKAQPFIDKMVSEHGFERGYIVALLKEARYRKNIINSMERPAEKIESWGEYREKRLTNWRIKKGIEFYKKNEATLKRAEQSYQVPPEIIVAIIGVETNYGRFMGGERVLDSMSTIAFDYEKRSKEFQRYFADFLLLTREMNLDPLQLKGSYAGALGYGQFMPGSYRSYAVDFDGDGEIDIINNVTDAIGSVANYIKRHGWQPGEQIVTRAALTSTDLNSDTLTRSPRRLKKLKTTELKILGLKAESEPPSDEVVAFKLTAKDGEQYWLANKNLIVITKYNFSFKYAMLVNDLSEALKSSL